MTTNMKLAAAMILAAGTAVSAQSLTPPPFFLEGHSWAYMPDYTQQLSGTVNVQGFRLIATANPRIGTGAVWQSDVELKLVSPNGTTLILGGSGENWTDPSVYISGTAPANNGDLQMLDATFAHNFGPIEGIWSVNFFNTWSSGTLNWTDIQVIPIELVTGACCLDNGSCEQLLESICATQGGTYHGDNSDCATIPPCPEPGACCFASGGCSLTGPATCAASGGTFGGPGSDCATLCPPPNDRLVPPNISVGANQWAFPSPYTQALTGTAEVNAFRLIVDAQAADPTSTWQSDMEIELTSPNGTTLLLGGTAAAWSSALHGGTAPLGNGGPQSFDGVYLHNFGPIDGTWAVNFRNTFSSGTLFWDNIQVIPVELADGACCLPSGACDVMLEVSCNDAGGIYNGDGTDCATIPNCPQPATGACCFNDGSCAIDWSGGCATQGGTYMGDNTDCAGVNCPNVLMTDPPNNGLSAAGSGIFLDLTATDALTVLRLDYVASASAGTPTQIDVWTRPGTYVGWDGDPSAWIMHDTVFSTSNGSSTNATLQLNNPLVIEAGETVGIYMIAQAGGIRYTGATGAQPHHSDPNLALFSDLARAEPWAGTVLTPRVFSGAIYYIMGGSGLCYANCDGSAQEPILTVDDFTCFINEFAQAQSLPHEQQVTHYANCDGSTSMPALTVDDFTCFINEFAQGCP